MTWIHFCEDPADFEPSANIETVGGFGAGLFVYRYDPMHAVDLAFRWHRDAVILFCPLDRVKLVQEDPLDEGPWTDEYFIPANALRETRVVRAWYRP